MPETKLMTVQIARAAVAFLERRGGRSNRGGGEFSRAAVLQRSVAMLRAMLEESDPRKTAGFPEKMVRIVAEVVEEPWMFRTQDVHHLADVVAASPGFAAAVAAAKLKAEEVRSRIAALSFAEKMALVDLAIQAQAPQAAELMPEAY